MKYRGISFRLAVPKQTFSHRVRRYSEQKRTRRTNSILFWPSFGDRTDTALGLPLVFATSPSHVINQAVIPFDFITITLRIPFPNKRPKTVFRNGAVVEPASIF